MSHLAWDLKIFRSSWVMPDLALWENTVLRHAGDPATIMFLIKVIMDSFFNSSTALLSSVAIKFKMIYCVTHWASGGSSPPISHMMLLGMNWQIDWWLMVSVRMKSFDSITQNITGVKIRQHDFTFAEILHQFTSWSRVPQHTHQPLATHPHS